MRTVRDDLRSYYEEEARRGLRGPVTGRRVAVRDTFIAQLQQEQCASVVDFGAGPGGDGQAFVAAGMRYVGLDLAHGNGLLASRDGLSVLQASIAEPPLRPASFDAGWSMSVLMHIPEEDLVAALAQMVRPLRPGALMLVGQWGGSKGDRIDERLPGERRLFSHRTLQRNTELLATCGAVVSAERWDTEFEDDYQVIVVRMPA